MKEQEIVTKNTWARLARYLFRPFRQFLYSCFSILFGHRGLDIGQEDPGTGLGNGKCIVGEMFGSSSTRYVSCTKLICCSCLEKRWCLAVVMYVVQIMHTMRHTHRREGLTLAQRMLTEWHGTQNFSCNLNFSFFLISLSVITYS